MKKIGLGILAALMALAFAGIVNAAADCNFTSPINTSGAVSNPGANNFNLTVVCGSEGHIANCTVNATSVTSGNATTILPTNLTNTSGGASGLYISALWNAKSVRDGDDYVFSGNCWNTSDRFNIAQKTGVDIDHTTPGCLWDAVFKDNGEYNPVQTWQVTGTNATSATIQFSDRASTSMTENSLLGDVFSYATTTNTLAEGIYDFVQVTTNDGTNTTACTIRYVSIDEENTVRLVGAILSGTGQKQAEAGTTGSTGNNNIAIIGLVVLAVILYRKRNQ